MASVWVEQFMLNGNMNVDYLINDVFSMSFVGSYNGQLGFGQEIARWCKNEKYDNCQDQGYSMGPWLQYMLNEIQILKPESKKCHPVLKLYDIFKKKWQNTTYNAYYIIEEWLNSYDKGLLGNYRVDDYYFELFRGQVVKDFDVHKLFDYNKNIGIVFKNKLDKREVNGKCYPYGCAVNKVQLYDFKDISLADKELIIKQETSGVNSFVLTFDKSSNFSKALYITKDKDLAKIVKGDSIKLTGKNLERFRTKDGDIQLEFYIVTTNILNRMHDEKTMNESRVTVELRDAKKQEEAKDVKISSVTYNLILNVGNSETDGVRLWQDETFLKEHMTVTKSGSGFKVTAKRKDGTNDESSLSFSVSGISNGKYTDAKDVVYSRQYLNEKYTVEATDVPCTYMSSWGTGATWRAYQQDGALNIKKVSYSKNDSNGKGPSYNSYLWNNENELKISVQFEE